MAMYAYKKEEIKMKQLCYKFNTYIHTSTDDNSTEMKLVIAETSH